MEASCQGGNAQRVLVIEENSDTAQQLVDCLRTGGYKVDLACDGDKGLALGWTADYAVMTVDRMRPRVDGLEVIQRLREHGIVTPTLIISALGEVDDRVRGLRDSWSGQLDVLDLELGGESVRRQKAPRRPTSSRMLAARQSSGAASSDRGDRRTTNKPVARAA